MGRQRGVLLGSILVVLSCLAVAQASLMAIDLGSENLKVSLIKPGRTPIAVVVNEMSKRKTPALVGFANGERLIGEEAASFLVRYPESIVMRARDLLGKPHNDSSVLTMLRDHNLPYKVVEHPTRKQAAVQVKEGVFVSAEELVGSTLQYARQIAEAQSGAPVLDAVIAVPAYFGQAQRQALIDSANLVGINVMGLINTHTAAALQFGIERDFTNKTENVIFYDMGAGGTVATLVRYSSYASKEAGPGKAVSQLEIRDVDWDSDLGANSLDTLLSEHFAKGFSTKSKIPLEEIMGNPRTMAKLKKQVRRTKEMLSANSAAPISVEELHDGRDFQSSITREEFETLAGGFFEQAAQPLKRILERSGLKIEELDYVELLGGGTRVPRLQAALTEALNGRILDRHVDADEAVVLGASLFAANLSTSFRLRKFGMADLSMYGVTLRIDEAHEPAVLPDATEPPKDQSAERNLLPYLKKLPAKRVVHFTNLTKDPIRVSLHYNASTPHPLPPGATEPELARFNITGIDTVIKRYNSSGTVNLRFEAAHDGILRLTRAEAVVEYVVMEEKLVPIKPPSTANVTATEETNTTTAEGKDEAAPSGAEPGETESPDGDIEDAPPVPSEGGEEAAEAADREGADVPPQASEEEGEEVKTKEGKTGEAGAEKTPPSPDPETVNATEPPAPKYETIIVSRKKVAKVTLNVSSSYTVEPLDGDDLKAAEAALAGWVAAELTKRQTAAAKNDLEAYIIKMRDAVENDEKILQVTIADQRTPFLASLAEAEDWLYMDGEGEAAAAFKERLAALRKVGNAMESRAQEFEARPQVMSAARKEAELKLAAVGLWEDSRPWITAEERKAIEEKLKTFLKGLDDKEALQAAKAVHEDPAFTAREVAVDYEKLEKAFNRIANKRKPKPPPEPPAPVNATANGTAAGNATDAEAGSAQPTGGDGSSTCIPEGDGSNCATPKTDAETEQPGGAPPDPKAEKAKKDAAEKAKKEAAEKAKKDAEKAKKEAADKAKKDKEAKAKAKKDKEEKAKKDKETKAKKEAADKAKKEKEAKAKGTGKPKATDTGKAKTGGKGDKNAEL